MTLRKLLYATFAFIIVSISATPAWCDDVIIDRLTKSQAEELNIVIPNETPPGFHSITIEVYDDNGVIKNKEIPFCKNLRGEINWDNKCPDVEKLASLEELLKIKLREDLPAYNPAQEPDKSSGLQITALALLAALAGSSRKNEGGANESQDSGDSSEPQQEELTSIDSATLARVEREIGWGDTSSTWKNPLTNASDYFFPRFALFISHYSPLVARTTSDGSYLRAIFGGNSLVLLPLAFLLGVKALFDTGTQAMAPTLVTVLAIVIVAIFDATAGALAASIFLIGTLLSGNITSRSEALTVLGVMALFVAPALLASAIRPLRRLVFDRDELWERATDYALTILLTGWIVVKMVNALNGLAGVQLAITYQAMAIGVCASISILIRMLGEDVATYLYPARLRKVTVELAEPSRVQKITSGLIKIGFFILLATPYVGVNPQLLLAGALFVLPLIATFSFADRLPKFEKIFQYLPKATWKLVLLTIVGGVLGGYLQGKFSDPTAFLRWCFVLVAIPGFLLSVFEWFAKESQPSWRSHQVGRIIYRVTGVLVFILAFQIVRGFDFSTLFSFTS